MYVGRSKETSHDNGFIYPLVCYLIQVLYVLNFVEWFKWVSKKLVMYRFRDFDDARGYVSRKVRRVSNYVIDGTILLKFSLLFLFISDGIRNPFITFVVGYLLFMNSFTYFYYHIWEEGAVFSRFQTLHRVRRRFVNFLISLVFMEACYTYLYGFSFVQNFSWDKKESRVLSSLLYSLQNTIPATYSNVVPLTQTGRVLSMSETIFVFVFVVIILARSLPQAEKS